MRTREERREAERVARTTRHLTVPVSSADLAEVLAALPARHPGLTVDGTPPAPVRVRGWVAFAGQAGIANLENSSCELTFESPRADETRITATVPDAAWLVTRTSHLGVHRLFTAIGDEIARREELS